MRYASLLRGEFKGRHEFCKLGPSRQRLEWSILSLMGAIGTMDRRTFLSVARSLVEFVLRSQIGPCGLERYLSAYDIGVAKGLYGEDTAIVSGLKIMNDCVISDLPIDFEDEALAAVIKEGARHGKFAAFIFLDCVVI